MVGYDSKATVQLSHKEHAVAAALSSAVSRALWQPLDVLKIRFQLQVEPIRRSSSNSKYRSLYQASSSILKEEGWKALWKGHVPAQILSVGYGVAQYTSFEFFTKCAWHLLPEKYSNDLYRPVLHTVCGGLSGCLASLCIHPVDVLRTRFIAQGEPKVYTSIYDAIGKIYKHEGIRGFYKGLVPAITQVGPQMGLQFGLYALCLEIISMIKDTPSTSMPGATESLFSGTAAGVVAKLIIYPFDIVKKRLQIQGFEQARQSFGSVRHYSGLFNCLFIIIKEETVLGLYKGLSPSLLKAGVVAGTNLCLYEQICKLLYVLKS
ncbi:hypothetical protein SNE40_019632 [Patella caerulea]|uniref:Mitochondrial thiamine pyrophosphate carrier n=1 Tax=Patella caerulea TaxID=87958 RepID=A0AAN8J9R9_PATCE